MIQSFSDRDTEELFQTESNWRFAAIARVALRKLIQMNQAGSLDDLKVPPGNRLEALKGRLAGYYSIRQRPVAHRVPMDECRSCRCRHRGLPLTPVHNAIRYSHEKFHHPG